MTKQRVPLPKHPDLNVFLRPGGSPRLATPDAEIPRAGLGRRRLDLIRVKQSELVTA